MRSFGVYFIFLVCVSHASASTTSYDCARALTLKQEKLDEQLFNAVNKRKPDLDQIKHIIDQGANVNAKFNNSHNTLAHIVQSVSALILLTKNGLNIESVNKWGENKLHYAARKNISLEFIQTFIDLSDEIDVLLDQRRSFDGATALMALAISGQSKQELNKMQLLIDYGSNVNTTFKDGLKYYTKWLCLNIGKRLNYLLKMVLMLL